MRWPANPAKPAEFCDKFATGRDSVVQERDNRRVAIYYDWYVIVRTGGRDLRRKLRWKMTMPDAIEWGLRPDNQGKILEAGAKPSRTACCDRMTR